MVDHAIHWAEGLFLHPHHFQAADRHTQAEIQLAEDWFEGYSYGLRKIDINEEALANWQIELRVCHARFRDGTHVRFPEDAILDPIDLPKDAFDSQRLLMIYVGIPRLQLGRKNAGSPVSGSAPNFRYVVESVPVVEDENDPGNPQSVDVRRPYVRLIVGEEDIAGYEALPVMRLKRGAMVESPPEIDPEYIPPILACDTWKILQNDILSAIYHHYGAAVESLSTRIVNRGVAFASGNPEDLQLLFKLYTLNAALGYLMNLPYARGIHPLRAYMELCRIAGMIAIFRQERRLPSDAPPRYDHDALGICFYGVKRLLDEIGREGPQVIIRPFKGAGLQLQVRLEPEWLSPGWHFFIGVDSQLTYDQIVSLLNGRLAMKVGSSRQVDQIFLKGYAGVALIPERHAPRDLPGNTWAYWRVNREAAGPWKDCVDTLDVAIRINEKQIVGKIDGLNTVHVRTESGTETAMSFVLYAIPAKRPQ